MLEAAIIREEFAKVWAPGNVAEGVPTFLEKRPAE